MRIHDQARILAGTLQDEDLLREKLLDLCKTNSAYRAEVLDRGARGVISDVRRWEGDAIRRGRPSPTLRAAEGATVQPGGDQRCAETQGSIDPARPDSSAGGQVVGEAQVRAAPGASSSEWDQGNSSSIQGEGGPEARSANVSAHGRTEPQLPGVRPSLGQVFRAASYPGAFGIFCEGKAARRRLLRWGDLGRMENVDEAIRLSRDEWQTVSPRVSTEYAKVMGIKALLEFNLRRKEDPTLQLMPDALQAVMDKARHRFNKTVHPELPK